MEMKIDNSNIRLLKHFLEMLTIFSKDHGSLSIFLAI